MLESFGRAVRAVSTVFRLLVDTSDAASQQDICASAVSPSLKAREGIINDRMHGRRVSLGSPNP